LQNVVVQQFVKKDSNNQADSIHRIWYTEGIFYEEAIETRWQYSKGRRLAQKAQQR